MYHKKLFRSTKSRTIAELKFFIFHSTEIFNVIANLVLMGGEYKKSNYTLHISCRRMLQHGILNVFKDY